MLDCPRCSGFWLGLAWYIAWIVWPEGALVAAVPLAIIAVVGLTEDLRPDE